LEGGFRGAGQVRKGCEYRRPKEGTKRGNQRSEGQNPARAHGKTATTKYLLLALGREGAKEKRGIPLTGPGGPGKRRTKRVQPPSKEK